MKQLEALLQQKMSMDSRAQLLGQRADAAGQDGASHRDRLLSSTQKLQGSGERLKQSRQMVADMEVSALRLLSIRCTYICMNVYIYVYNEKYI